MRIDKVVVYPCDLSESVKIPNGLFYPDKKEIIYRVNVRDHIKYEIDCMIVDDGYLELMKEKIHDDCMFYNMNDYYGYAAIKNIKEYKDCGFFMMIDGRTFCYSLGEHYSGLNSDLSNVLSYSEWIIKRILE